MQISTCTGWLAACYSTDSVFLPGCCTARASSALQGRSSAYVLTWLLSWCKPAVPVPVTHVHCSCPACRWMASDYRRPLLLEEILGYNADILCLQEVDEKAFRVFFGPQFWHAGGSCAGAACQHCCTAQSKALPHSTAAACQSCCAELSRAHLQLFCSSPPQDTVWPSSGDTLAANRMVFCCDFHERCLQCEGVSLPALVEPCGTSNLAGNHAQLCCCSL